MSTRLTITTAGTDPAGLEEVMVVVESDPPIPMIDGEPDVDQLTADQAAGIFAAHALHDAQGGEGDWRTLVRGRS